MGDKNLKQRKDIEQKYKWDIEAMYPDETNWEKDLEDCRQKAEEFAAYQGRLTESARTLSDALQLRDAIWLKLEHAFVYAHMKKDEDNREAKYQAMDDKCNSVIARVSAVMSFFTPELLEAPEERILSYIEEEPDLKTYEFMLKD
ncbi:MAG: oligoendopeptidase F, partial [Firmicutes bacterium]|nr:oligoendopeptidase F [Bacillota bacterium]